MTVYVPKFQTSIHIIGEVKNGIVITTFNPFRVTIIKRSAIIEYNNTLYGPPDPDDTFKELCKALAALVIDLGDTQTMTVVDDFTEILDDLTSMGAKINNSDFCISTKIDLPLHNESMAGGTGGVARRSGYSMFHGLIEELLAMDVDVHGGTEFVPRKSDDDHHHNDENHKDRSRGHHKDDKAHD